MLNILTVNALAAASEVLIPVQCEYYALEGLTSLMETIDLVKRGLNPTLSYSRIGANHVRRQKFVDR